MMRWDVEKAAAETVVAYLSQKVDASITASCPIVSYFDISSIEELDRIVVDCTSGQSATNSPSTIEQGLEIVITSTWHEKTIVDDFQTHFDRVGAVRDKMFSETITADVDALASGIGIDYVFPQWHFRTTVREGFIVTETTLTFSGFLRDDQPATQ